MYFLGQFILEIRREKKKKKLWMEVLEERKTNSCVDHLILDIQESSPTNYSADTQ